MEVMKKNIVRAGLAISALLIAGQGFAKQVQNCPPSRGNTDVFTRTVDVRSAPGSAGSDFREVEKAMRSGETGRLAGVCIEGHSNIPNTLASTQAEARAFGQKMRTAGLAEGVPIYVSGYSNSQPKTNRPAEYVTATGERARIQLNPSNIQQAILNHRIVVHYVYSCAANTNETRNSNGRACVAPYSGLAAGPLLSGATLAAPGAAAAAAAPAALGGLGAVAGGVAAAAAIAAALAGGDGGSASAAPSQ